MSKGTRNFEACQVKNVKFSTSYQLAESDATSTVSKIPKGADPGRYDAFVYASLNCPKIDDTRVESSSLRSRVGAYDELRKLAAKVACGSCAFSRMSRAEVDTVLGDEAEAQTRRLRAQIELAKAQQEYNETLRLGQEAVRAIEVGIQPQLLELPLQTIVKPQ